MLEVPLLVAAEHALEVAHEAVDVALAGGLLDDVLVVVISGEKMQTLSSLLGTDK